MAFKMCAGWVAGAGIVVFTSTPCRGLFESGRLVDGHAGGSILIFGVGVDEFGGEGVFSAVGGGRGRWGRRQIMAVKINV